MNTSAEPGGRLPRWELAVVAILLSAGLAARCYQIGYNFDGDEVFSVELASRCRLLLHLHRCRLHPC